MAQAIPAVASIASGLLQNRSNRQQQSQAQNTVPAFMQQYINQVVSPLYGQVGSGQLNPMMPTQGLTAPLDPLQNAAGGLGMSYLMNPMTQGLMNSGFRGNQQLMQGLNPNQNPLLGNWAQNGRGANAGANALLGTAFANPSLGSGTALQQPMIEALASMLSGGRGAGRGNETQAPQIQYVGGGTSGSFDSTFNSTFGGGGNEPENPNIEAAIEAQADAMRRQFARTTERDLEMEAVMNGGFGGSPRGIALGVARGDLERSINDTTAATRNAGFENRANRQLQRDLARQAERASSGGYFGGGQPEALAFQQEESRRQSALQAAQIVQQMLGTGYGQSIDATQAGMSPFFSNLNSGASLGFNALQSGVGMMPGTLGSGFSSLYGPAMSMGGQFQQYQQGGIDRQLQAYMNNAGLRVSDLGLISGMINGTNPGAFRPQAVGAQQNPFQTALGAFGALSSMFGGQGSSGGTGGGWGSWAGVT